MTMLPTVALNFLRWAASSPLYLVDDRVFAVRRGPGRGRGLIRLVASLNAEANVILRRLRVHDLQTFHGTFTVTDRNVCAFRFTVGKLIPHLRYLASHCEQDLICPSDLRQQLADLSAKASGLEDPFTVPLSQFLPVALLTEAFSPPCAIVNQCVIPMELATDPIGVDGVVVNFVPYRLCPDRAQPLAQVLARINQTVQMHWARVVLGLDGYGQKRKAVADALEKVIQRFTSRRVGAYRILYADARHQIQYSAGQFVVVHGPINRGTSPNTYVGLHIVGKNRMEHLQTPPRCAPAPSAFWDPHGLPLQGGMCMGDLHQYRHLYSSTRSDAMAVMQWLAAGVSIVQGRRPRTGARRIDVRTRPRVPLGR